MESTPIWQWKAGEGCMRKFAGSMEKLRWYGRTLLLPGGIALATGYLVISGGAYLLDECGNSMSIYKFDSDTGKLLSMDAESLTAPTPDALTLAPEGKMVVTGDASEAGIVSLLLSTLRIQVYPKDNVIYAISGDDGVTRFTVDAEGRRWPPGMTIIRSAATGRLTTPPPGPLRPGGR